MPTIGTYLGTAKEEVGITFNVTSAFGMAVEGAEFGDWITAGSRSNGYVSGDLIEIPCYIAEWLLRHVGLTENNINVSSFDAAGNTTDGYLKDWKFAGAIAKPMSAKNVIGEILRQSKSRIFKNEDGQWQWAVYRSNASVNYSDYKFDKDNNTRNVKITKTSELYNTLRVNYFYDYGPGKYKKQVFIECIKKYSGSLLDGAITSGASSMAVDDGTDFSNGDEVVIDDEILLCGTPTANSVPITRAQKGSIATAHVDNTVIYIVTTGSSPTDSTRETTAVQAIWKYHVNQSLEINANWINDDDTAQYLLDHLFDFHSQPRYVVEFDTMLMASDLEIGDVFEFDHTVMDGFLKLGGESWSSKNFECIGINRSGVMDFHIIGLELK